MKALFFGLGGVGQRHLRILKELKSDVKIAAVRKSNRTFEILDNMAVDYSIDITKKYNIELFDNIDEALLFKPDLVIIATPTSTHVSIATRFIINNIPVFIEKPISDSKDNLSFLLKKTSENNAIVMIGYMMRFNPCAIKLKDLIAKRILGKIYAVTLNVNSYMPSWHKYENYNEFYAGIKELGGGVILTEIHEIDLLSWFFGAPNRVWAIGGRLSNFDIDVEDTVGVLMHQPYEGKYFPINLNICYVEPAPHRKMIIIGEKGIIEWDILNNSISVSIPNNEQVERYHYPEFQRNDMFRAQMEHFIDCVANHKKPVSSIDDVITGHLTALTIKKSLETESVVKQIEL